MKIKIPTNIDYQLDKEKNIVILKGPRGCSKIPLDSRITTFFFRNNEFQWNANKNISNTLYRNLENSIQSVLNGNYVLLQLESSSYKAWIQDSKLMLDLGYSHTIECLIPITLKVKILSPRQICIYGTDKHEIGNYIDYLIKLKKSDGKRKKGIAIISLVN